MLDYIFSGLCAAISEMIEVVVVWFLDTLNLTKAQFDTVFPFAKATFSFFQDFAILIVLFLAGVSVYNIFSSRGKNRDTPSGIVVNVLLAIAGIYLGNYILEAIVSLGMIGYNAILAADISPGVPEVNLVSTAMSAISSYVAPFSILFYLVVLGLIAFHFAKVLLEAIERFLWIYILMYTSPLAFSTLASSATNGTFSKFFNMFVSQTLLMILNIWSIKMALSVFASIGTIGNNTTPVVPLLFGFAFLRIAQRFDSTLNQLGMNAAITGGGLGADLIGSFASVGKRFAGGVSSLFGGGSGGGGGSGSGGGIGDAAKKTAAAYQKVSPIGWASRATVNYASAGASTILDAVKHGSEQAQSGGDFWTDAKDYYLGNIGRASAQANSKTQQENIWSNMAHAPQGYATATDAMASAVIDPDTKISRESYEIGCQRGDLGTAVMSKLQNGNGIVESRERTAMVLQSMKIPETEAFITAANGPGFEQVAGTAVMDKNGLRMSYRDGKGEHRLEVLNHAQYTALHAGNRESFQEHIAPDGSKKYYRMQYVDHKEPEGSAPPVVDTLPAGPGGPGAVNEDPGKQIGSASVYGPSAALEQASYSDEYTEEQITLARTEAYRYHSGGELQGPVSPATAGEILDGYTNGGTTPVPHIPVSDGPRAKSNTNAGTIQSPVVNERTAEQKVPQVNSAINTEKPVSSHTSDSHYSQVGGERTKVQIPNTSSSPNRGLDLDVDRVYRVARATSSANVPRRENVRSAKLDENGIHMKTETGVWEMRPAAYVHRQSEQKQKEYTPDYMSPQGIQYYTRFRPIQTKESHQAKKEKVQDQD